MMVLGSTLVGAMGNPTPPGPTRVGEFEVPLPPGVYTEWRTDRAWSETTPTRERICLNGLWRWQPSSGESETPPISHWGFFKVPGPWPGITDYMQKESQTLHAHPAWQHVRLRDVRAAWHEREITIPAHWRGRRITLQVEYLNSRAVAFWDGRPVGTMHFPADELDVTSFCQPGRTHRLTLLVQAWPLQALLQSYTDTAAPRDVPGFVPRRGLCGDVFLAATPSGPRLGAVRIVPSVRRWDLTVDAALENLQPGHTYRLAVRITEEDHVVREFRSPPFQGTDVHDGRYLCREPWRPEKLWDLHTPQHQYELQLSLLDAEGRALDILPPQRFGFREFWIDGRDFYLNGTRLYLSVVPLDNAQVSAYTATYEAARESLERLRWLGINFVYAHHYDCLPGSHLSWADILRAADDAGMLVALTQPHFSHYDWAGADADRTNGYARHAAFYVRVAGNHPSVVAYATSHNAAGYNEDMNPDFMDGRSAFRDAWAERNVERARRAEAIVRALDPDRLVYHHASGNLGSLHTSNFYPNFVPVQELSDWFEAWATRGIKPLFLCEYGAPFTWDWAMYRGWYRARREFGSAVVPWEFCLAEWNAQFLGDAAFLVSEMEKRNLRWEARQFREGRLWHRWDYPHPLSSADFVERDPVFALYLTRNWRAFRTWGVSAISPWEHHILFRLRPEVPRHRRENLPADWAQLQRPGYSPDFLAERFERFDLAYGRQDWEPTGAGRAILRNNRPLLAYLAGKPARFTSQDHLFVAGETVEKQLILINNSRTTVEAEAEWILQGVESLRGRARLSVPTGEQTRIPVRFSLPPNLSPGPYLLSARVTFSTGEEQTDELVLHVVSAPVAPSVRCPVALFDPGGETRSLLEGWGIPFVPVEPGADLTNFDMLVVGRRALTENGPAPRLDRVRQGLKVLAFEQSREVLERRLGFRVTEYGLRQVFPRLPDHPVLQGLTADHLRDWRGSTTLLPPRLQYRSDPRFYGAPTVDWCGIPVTRAWRCGNQGTVASVLIEKPARGDFLPLVDGGFSLQYSPLMEYREGDGLIVFCQLDVTGRTERDPVAETLVARLLEYVAAWKPDRQRRRAVYARDPAGRHYLQQAGFELASAGEGPLQPQDLLILSPGAAEVLQPHRTALPQWLREGGAVLALHCSAADTDPLLPFRLTFTHAEHISTVFPPPARTSPFAGIGPADVHCRDPRVLPLPAGGVIPLGNGVLAIASDAPVVFCQLVPWHFDYTSNYGLKRTFRRTAYLLNRLLTGLGVPCSTALLSYWATPPQLGQPGRWLQSYYLDPPEEWDDPYRFFRW